MPGLSPPSRLCLALVLLTLGSCSNGEASPARPDVVLVVVDTLRNDRLGCYGYDRPTSPKLDALVAEGVVCEDVTAQWPWTLPSMVSIFQGQYLTEYRDSLHPDAVTLPEAFQGAGYKTIGVVGNCLVDEKRGFARGFDQLAVVDCWLGDDKETLGEHDILHLNKLLAEPASAAFALDSAGQRAPVFVYVHAFDPHDPYLQHAGLDAALPVDHARAVEPEGYWMEQIRARGSWDEAPPMRLKNWKASFQRMPKMRGRYDQEIRYFDEGFAQLTQDLRAAGLSQDTVFALVSDHGEGLWDHVSNESPETLRESPPHSFFYKPHGGNGYQTVSATPFLLWGAGVPKGVRIKAAVENVDLFPTLLELADIAPPAGLHGRSLVCQWQGPSQAWRTHVFSGGSHTMAVRDVRSQMKLILPMGKSIQNRREVELFDLNADPGERKNLAEERSEVLGDLVDAHRRWSEQYPTETTLRISDSDFKSTQDKALIEKLRALGYTESDTGIAIPEAASSDDGSKEQ